MYIQRVQIEEGFLDGLDVKFTPGLNAIIGARGTGKTSLIEIIRFCLDVNSTTAETTRRSKDHALSVLGSGQVTITLTDGENTILVSRTANDPAPRSTAKFRKPVIFSQTEIETVGLEATGRLKLIDGFVKNKPDTEAQERELITECRNLTQQIEESRREIEELELTQKALPALREELKLIIPAEENVSKTSENLKQKTHLLSVQNNTISSAGVMVENISRIKNSVANWSHEVKKGIDNAPINSISLEHGAALILNPILEKINTVKTNLISELGNVLNIYSELETVLSNFSTNKISMEDQARQLRQEIESIQSGSGSILRRGQELRESIAKLESISTFLAPKKASLSKLISTRSEALDKLDEIREERFFARSYAADSLNKIVAPNIKVSVFRNGQSKVFAAAILEALRGSGLRYGDAVEAIANNISPRALLEAVDNFDVSLVEDAANITSDRASRLLSHLKSCDLGEICTINIEDDASLQLLDGTDYKDISELSTGQRCTVVLPLILSHMNRMLIVDQPEDHIDNAFIAETLIKVILSRGEQGQTIFSTHNPNIPVLGDADLVLHLGSDGRRGFRLSSGPLDEVSIVNAISTVMEGGAKAFSQRARFYGEHIK
ncbi:AAA family ATPase [Pseudomonas sp. SWRI196]|uniref:AAA family ATPase n=1 Tax=Pseudomonas tehranensis TaxID=2745502 RepID=A0ABR6UQQ5_9PSED|nr:AAA family ATPase [Pseudomonas tehranensis]MBC3346914.1 AAA family ATPase [Pseudomonas tehranensis]